MWKRAEWVAGEVDRFMTSPGIANALTMIDWGSRYIRLLPNASKIEDSTVLVTDEIVAKSLRPHDQVKGSFTREEAAIRDWFDQLLDGLERFEAFVDVGLVTIHDLVPYLQY